MFPTRRFRRSPAMQQSSPSMSTVLLRRRPWVIFVDVDLFCHLSIYLLVSYWYLYVSVGIYWHLSVSMGWPSYPQMFIFSNEDSQQFLEFVGGPVAWWRLVKHHMGRPNQDCRNLFVGSCWLFAKIDQNSLSSSWIILILDISRYVWSRLPSAHRLRVTQGDQYLDNINVGNLAGTLWYIHNEARDESKQPVCGCPQATPGMKELFCIVCQVVFERPRKFNISKLIRYKSLSGFIRNHLQIHSLCAGMGYYECCHHLLDILSVQYGPFIMCTKVRFVHKTWLRLLRSCMYSRHGQAGWSH